jgi:outer membrane protein assembly factor BamB
VNWEFPAGSEGGFLVHKGKIYFSGLDHFFYAVDIATKETLWKTPYEKGVGLTPSRFENLLMIPTSQDPTYFLNIETGKVEGTFSFGSGTMAPLAVSDDGWVYALSNSGNLHAFKLRSGSHWREPETLFLPSAIFGFAYFNRNHGPT